MRSSLTVRLRNPRFAREDSRQTGPQRRAPRLRCHPGLAGVLLTGPDFNRAARRQISPQGGHMKTTARVMTFAASCLMAAAPGFGFEAGAPAAAQTGAEPYSKVCREGPRSREVEIQKIEPFKMF